MLRLNIESTIGRLLPDELYNAFSALFVRRSFDRKSLLSEPDRVCRHIYFIESGSCYSYITDETGERHALQFALENYWISDLYSFLTGRIAVYGIEALEHVEAWVLSEEDFQKACEIPVFDRFFRLLTQNAYISLQYRLARTNSLDAEQRYEEFSRLHPDFLQRIPQYLIATYLGIQPQSLSRIRKERLHKV